MTKNNLRKAIASILSNSDNPDFLAKLYEGQGLGPEQLIEKGADEICTDGLLEYVNAHLEEVPGFSMEDDDFARIIEDHRRNWSKGEGPIFPLVGGCRVCCVHSELDGSICQDGLIRDAFLVTYISENGEAFNALHETIEFKGKFEICRKVDDEPWSLSELGYEGALPEKFTDFWD